MSVPLSCKSTFENLRGYSEVSVPGSSANLGCGFDCGAIALPVWLNMKFTTITAQLHQAIQLGMDISDISKTEGDILPVLNSSNESEHIPQQVNTLNYIKVEGLGSELIMKELKENLILYAANATAQKFSAGLGSSAAAIVAGICMASCVLKLNLDKHQVYLLALAIEGHGDNVSASVYGGLNIALETGVVQVSPISSLLLFTVITPSYMLPTKESRSVLPSTYALSQFVPNIGRFAALTHLLCRKDLSDVSNAALIPGLHEMLQWGYDDFAQKGVLGLCLSGAGPSVLGLSTNTDAAEAIGRRACDVFAAGKLGATATYFVCAVEEMGCQF